MQENSNDYKFCIKLALDNAKESLLSTLDALSNIHSTDLIQIQIKEIYNKLEQMHDNRKKIESATNYL